jgi:hypothetical protein
VTHPSYGLTVLSIPPLLLRLETMILLNFQAPLLPPLSCSLSPWPKAGQGRLILDVSRPYTMTTRVGRTPLDKGSACRRDLYLHKTRHSQETDIRALGGIWTRDPRKQVVAESHLRRLGHCDRIPCCATGIFYLQFISFLQDLCRVPHLCLPTLQVMIAHWPLLIETPYVDITGHPISYVVTAPSNAASPPPPPRLQAQILDPNVSYGRQLRGRHFGVVHSVFRVRGKVAHIVSKYKWLGEDKTDVHFAHGSCDGDAWAKLANTASVSQPPSNKQNNTRHHQQLRDTGPRHKSVKTLSVPWSHRILFNYVFSRPTYKNICKKPYALCLNMSQNKQLISSCSFGSDLC